MSVRVWFRAVRRFSQGRFFVTCGGGWSVAGLQQGIRGVRLVLLGWFGVRGGVCCGLFVGRRRVVVVLFGWAGRHV